MNKKYNFDQIIPRRDTNSAKWKRYPEDVLPLWVADMDFSSSKEIVESLKARATHPCYGYGCDDEELRTVICQWAENHYGWEIHPEWLLFVPGVVTGMNWAIQSQLKPGQKIGFHTPIYPPFLKFAGNADVNEARIPLTQSANGFEIDFELFEKAIQECSVFAFCNPHNPAGRVFTRAELEQIADICLRNGVVICSDEIHCDLVYNGHRHIPIASLSHEIASRVITLMAPSKTFNIPGLEFSFAIVPDANLRKKMETSRRGLVGHPSIFAYPAAKAAYMYGEEWLQEAIDYLEANRDFLADYFRDHFPRIGFHKPEGTYLAWLDCRELTLGMDPYEFFLKEAKVALNCGLDFGQEGNGFVRLNFATPRSILHDALKRMRAALSK